MTAQSGNVDYKMRKTDIILILRPIDNKALNSIGLLDKTLFKDGAEGNKLHAIMDTQTCLWYLKYERGLIPPALRQQWTSYHKLLDFVKTYMKSRNIEIVEIRD